MGLNERIEARRKRSWPAIFPEEHYERQLRPWDGESGWAMARDLRQVAGILYLHGCNLFLQKQLVPQPSRSCDVEGPES